MSETSTDTAAAMRLRADPPRVTRISRKVIVGLGVVAGLGIGAALIYGLQGPDRTTAPEEVVTTDRRQPADGLRDLPGSYDAIPRLGPPLPGDLGGDGVISEAAVALHHGARMEHQEIEAGVPIDRQQLEDLPRVVVAGPALDREADPDRLA